MWCSTCRRRVVVPAPPPEVLLQSWGRKRSSSSLAKAFLLWLWPWTHSKRQGQGQAASVSVSVTPRRSSETHHYTETGRCNDPIRGASCGTRASFPGPEFSRFSVIASRSSWRDSLAVSAQPCRESLAPVNKSAIPRKTRVFGLRERCLIWFLVICFEGRTRANRMWNNMKKSVKFSFWKSTDEYKFFSLFYWIS